ncbi:MAG: hypothetical protein WC786_00120 [Patescibacteria group bacterium]|jgi:dephospho-CoA kinase
MFCKIAAEQFDAQILSASTLLRKILEERGEPISRGTLQALGAKIHDTEGPTSIICSLLRKARESQLTVIDAVRYAEELTWLAQRPDFVLVGLQTHLAMRLERIRSRNRDASESNLGVDDLRQQDKQPTERDIPFLLSSASDIIVNNGTVAEFTEEVQSVLRHILKRHRVA